MISWMFVQELDFFAFCLGWGGFLQNLSLANTTVVGGKVIPKRNFTLGLTFLSISRSQLTRGVYQEFKSFTPFFQKTNTSEPARGFSIP